MTGQVCVSSNIFTFLVVRISISDCNYLCQHFAEPLRVNEVEVTQKTSVIVIKENPIFMKKTCKLFKIIFIIVTFFA